MASKNFVAVPHHFHSPVVTQVVFSLGKSISKSLCKTRILAFFLEFCFVLLKTQTDYEAMEAIYRMDS